MPDTAPTAIAINCTLVKTGARKSSTDAMIGVLGEAFAECGVTISETIRIADHDVFPGVTSNEGKGDAWPAIREKILAHDILVFGTPIWMGQISSVAKRVLERMDAFLSETDDAGRMPSYSKVAVAACYWVGEAMSDVNFVDLQHRPRMVSTTAKMVAGNAAHLAGLLKTKPYPG